MATIIAAIEAIENKIVTVVIFPTMPEDSQKTTTLSIALLPEMKERIKRFAEEKHWSVSQSVAMFIDAHWERWEQENGVKPPQKNEK